METMQNKLTQQFQNIDKAYEAYAKSKGMTYLSLMVLEEIYLLGNGCTQKQISEDTLYPKQSINLVIKSFIKEEIIDLKELQNNRKNKGIYLTSKGTKMCNDIIVPLLKQEEQILTEMGESESKELIRLLKLYGEKYCEHINGL